MFCRCCVRYKATGIFTAIIKKTPRLMAFFVKYVPLIKRIFWKTFFMALGYSGLNGPAESACPPADWTKNMVALSVAFNTDVGTSSAVTKVLGVKVIFVFCPDGSFVVKATVATVPLPLWARPVGEITRTYEAFPFLASILLSSCVASEKNVPFDITILVIVLGS